ncbi:LysR family transcriptional regulator [Erwinia pyri]|uniref:LysR family transcriptional regulator n=1 Tax=Erwinia pyri TaxID=3062598 RepID=UPI003D185F8A
MSAQIRQLEKDTGQRLLRRTGRGVVPTKEGEMLPGFAVRILALGEMALAQLSESTPAGSGPHS